MPRVSIEAGVIADALSADAEGPNRAVSSPAAVSLYGAINEVVAFTFSIDLQDNPIGRAGLQLTPLESVSGSISPTAITVYRMQRVSVARWPGWHIRSIPPDRRDKAPFDVLVPWRAPRGGFPGVLLPGQEYRFWVDVAIPKGTAPGVYRGRINVTDADRAMDGVEFSVEVRSLVLPGDDATPMIAAVDHRSLLRHHLRLHGASYAPPGDDWRSDPLREEIDGLITSTVRMLRAHRITPVLPDLAPIARFNARGELTFDWSAYDEIVTSFLDGKVFIDRLPIAVWPLPVRPIQRASSDREAHGALARQFILEGARHFHERGWLDRAYLAVDPPPSTIADALAGAREYGALAREANPTLPVLTQLFPQTMSPYGWPGFPTVDMRNMIDVWAPPAQFFDREVMRAERRAGRRTWLTVDRPPFSGTVEVGAPAGCVLGLPWQAAELGAGAMLLPTVNHWPAETGVEPATCAAFDNRSLLYPGEAFGLSEPVPSVRLKLLRRAMQDAVYRKVLEDSGDAHVVEALEESLVTYVGTDAYRAHYADGRPIGFALEASRYEAARRIMADRLGAGMSGRNSVVESASFAQDATWRRFMLDTRGVDTLQDGCRVRAALSDEQNGLWVDCWMTILNRTRVPITGLLRWDVLLAGWTSPERTWAVPSIAPNVAGRFLLSVVAAAFDTRGGAIGLSAVLAADDGTVRRFPVRLTFAVAQPLERPVVIDGDLSDWGAGRYNVASDFRLISATLANDAAGSASYPASRTIAFIARDRDALYVAVNCARDPDVPLSFTGGNAVHYEDMIPVGEELVELLFDPLNAGTRIPSDLFHLVIKPSGAHLAERGIALDPPCGTRSPWPADAQVAARIEPERWTVEVRIPFASFGGGFTASTVWGFNVTRADATTQQFSTWSGATGNAYDPLSTGNLYLPDAGE